MPISTTRAVCPHDCPDTCSMLVTLDEGRAVAFQGDPDHEFTHGHLCHKVSRYAERVYHRDRLLTPLRRSGPKGSGQFRRISWDEALDEIASRMNAAAESSAGPESILPYSYCGTMGKIQGESLDRRFFHRLGASLLDRTICATAGVAGYRYTMGTGRGMNPDAFADSRYIINWGSNTAVTNMHLWVKMLDARKRGAKIVTIDPFRCKTAERSDWHIMPRVGTDAALALGLMHILFRDGHADEEYLADYCLGGAELRERVLNEYPPDRVADITGVAVDDIECLAREYATTPPAAIRVNYGLQRHRGGGMAVRTIACLPAIIGAWRDRAGGVLLSTSALYPLNLQALHRPDLIPEGTRTVNMVQLAEALHGELGGPPVNVLYVYNSNPAAVAPDQQRVLAGLKRDDLFTVVHELFPTDTFDYADIVIPATSQVEHRDLHTSYGHHYVQWNEPCIEPLGESKCNTDVFRELAKRLGFEDRLFQVSDEDLAREALWESSPDRPSEFAGITVETLRRDGPQKLRLANDDAPYARGGFATPSGKCELLCPGMEAAGLDPLPAYIAPAECRESSPALASRYPLQLISPPSPHFLNSSFANVDSLKNSAREPAVYLHPDDASPRGIADGDIVRVFNDRGSFTVAASVGEFSRPGVAVAPSVWWNKFARDGRNVNSTTSTAVTDMGGGATFFDNLVEVEGTLGL